MLDQARYILRYTTSSTRILVKKWDDREITNLMASNRFIRFFHSQILLRHVRTCRHVCLFHNTSRFVALSKILATWVFMCKVSSISRIYCFRLLLIPRRGCKLKNKYVRNWVWNKILVCNHFLHANMGIIC